MTLLVERPPLLVGEIVPAPRLCLTEGREPRCPTQSTVPSTSIQLS